MNIKSVLTLNKILPTNVSTYIDGNSLTTNEIAANTIVAGNIASLNFYGKSAKFDTGDIGGWLINSDKLSKDNGTYTTTN